MVRHRRGVVMAANGIKRAAWRQTSPAGAASSNAAGARCACANKSLRRASRSSFHVCECYLRLVSERSRRGLNAHKRLLHRQNSAPASRLLPRAHCSPRAPARAPAHTHASRRGALFRARTPLLAHLPPARVGVNNNGDSSAQRGASVGDGMIANVAHSWRSVARTNDIRCAAVSCGTDAERL